MTKFKVSDEVEIIKYQNYYADYGDAQIPNNLIIPGCSEPDKDKPQKVVCFYKEYTIVNFTSTVGKEMQLGYKPENLKLIKKNKAKTEEKKEEEMRRIASEVYEKTSDAVLVDKWATKMGVNDNFSDVLLVKANKAEFLKEAKRLEAEANKNSE